MPEQVEVETVGGVALVRIKRPPANALAPDLLAEGAALMEELRADPPDALVVTGEGEFFSGGADLKLTPTLAPDELAGMVSGINRLFIDWYGFPRPVVAAVNGHAVAGGMILAICADRRIGSETATYGLTEVRVGFPYPAAAIACVRAELSKEAARRCVLEGELLDAETALGYGLVDELLPAGEVLDRSFEVARELAKLPTRAYETVKEQLRGPALELMRSGAAADPMSVGLDRNLKRGEGP